MKSGRIKSYLKENIEFWSLFENWSLEYNSKNCNFGNYLRIGVLKIKYKFGVLEIRIFEIIWRWHFK